MTRLAWSILLVMGTLFCLVVVPAPFSDAETGRRSSPGSLVAAVAIVDWQFPMAGDPGVAVHPRQRELLANPARRSLLPALHPNLSEANASSSEWSLERLGKHARRCAASFALGRTDASAFLLNVSAATPAVLEVLADEGLRIVSMSIGGRDEEARHLDWVERLARAHPELLFVVSTPHISGNSITVEALGEVPSVLATRGLPNVLLVGVLRDHDLEDPALPPPGTKERPFHVDNQPVGESARQVYMVNGRSTRVFVEGFGGTSAAAPHLAALLALIATHRQSRGETIDASALLEELDALCLSVWAREKSGHVHEVKSFTLDTVLLNAGRPLVSEAIWGVHAGRAAPPRRIGSPSG